MTYTEQLEREAEQTRSELAGTLDELRTRISPGNVVDQLVDYAQEGSGGEFFYNLKRQTVANPLPVTLIGAGLAWLMIAGSRSGQSRPSDEERASDYAEMGPDMLGYRPDGENPADEASTSSMTGSAVDKARSATQKVGDTASSTYGSAADKARSTAQAVGDTAADARDRAAGAARSTMSSIKNTASSTYGAASSAYGTATDTAARTAASVAGSAKQVGRGAATTSRNFVDFCRDQPLVLAGIGVALGAALGALLPATKAEDELMGEASESAKQGVREGVAEAYDKVAAVTERAADAVREEADKQGLTQMAEGAAQAAGLPSGALSGGSSKKEGSRPETGKSDLAGGMSRASEPVRNQPSPQSGASPSSKPELAKGMSEASEPVRNPPSPQTGTGPSSKPELAKGMSEASEPVRNPPSPQTGAGPSSKPELAKGMSEASEPVRNPPSPQTGAGPSAKPDLAEGMSQASSEPGGRPAASPAGAQGAKSAQNKASRTPGNPAKSDEPAPVPPPGSDGQWRRPGSSGPVGR
jgi:hypothetical protein